MSVGQYFHSDQFNWALVATVIGVVITALGAVSTYATGAISWKEMVAAVVGALIFGLTRLAEGINDAARQAAGDALPRDVTGVPSA